MTNQPVVLRDERTVAVENTSFKWACNFITFALLIDVMYRGLVRSEAAWDLMALACVPGIISTIYQAHQKTMAGWAAVVMVCGAVVVAAYIAAVLSIPSLALIKSQHVRWRGPLRAAGLLAEQTRQNDLPKSFCPAFF